MEELREAHAAEKARADAGHAEAAQLKLEVPCLTLGPPPPYPCYTSWTWRQPLNLASPTALLVVWRAHRPPRRGAVVQVARATAALDGSMSFGPRTETSTLQTTYLSQSMWVIRDEAGRRWLALRIECTASALPLLDGKL